MVMTSWDVNYWDSLLEKKLWASGTAHSTREAEDQARNHLEWGLSGGDIAPGDLVEVRIGSVIHYEGTAEGFMGKTALRRMGL